MAVIQFSLHMLCNIVIRFSNFYVFFYLRNTRLLHLFPYVWVTQKNNSFFNLWSYTKNFLNISVQTDSFIYTYQSYLGGICPGRRAARLRHCAQTPGSRNLWYSSPQAAPFGCKVGVSHSSQIPPSSAFATTHLKRSHFADHMQISMYALRASCEEVGFPSSPFRRMFSSVDLSVPRFPVCRQGLPLKGEMEIDPWISVIEMACWETWRAHLLCGNMTKSNQ